MIRILTVSAFAAMTVAAAAANLAPRDQWKADIADQNFSYSKRPHAMLKIQDSAYIGEGQSAALQGKPGVPGSWKWGHGKGALLVSLKGGKLSVIQGGKDVSGLITNSIVIDKDIDVAGQPTQVGAGINGWRLFVYNQQAPAAKTFTSVSYFPYDPAWRITASFTPDLKLPPRVFRTSRGTDKQFFHAGEAHLVLNGKQVTLPFYTGSNKPGEVEDMSAFFTDSQTGHGTYGAGRYVDVAGFGKFPPRQVTIEFNEAYNPNCARSPHFTCPVAIDNIPVAVTAGERDPHAVH